LEGSPNAICFVTEDDDVVLAVIQIQTDTGLGVAFAGPVMSARDVIDMDQKSSALGMGYFNEFHRVITS
jgi:hypothetical protein